MQHLSADSYSLMRETSSWCSRTLNRLMCDCLGIAHLMWYIRDRRLHVFYKLCFLLRTSDFFLLTSILCRYYLVLFSVWTMCASCWCCFFPPCLCWVFFLLITSQTNVTLRFFHCIWNFVWQQKMFQMSKLKYIYWASGTIFTKHP